LVAAGTGRHGFIRNRGDHLDIAVCDPQMTDPLLVMD
jgi:hypothetical protein